MSKLELETDNRLLQAIEAISGGDLDCSGDCGNAMCDGGHPENCDQLWSYGEKEEGTRKSGIGWTSITRIGETMPH